MEVVFAEPKPCPFCGTNVKIQNCIISCPQCGAMQKHETGSYWNCMVSAWNRSVNAYKELDVGSGYQFTATGIKPILPKQIFLLPPGNENRKFREIYERAETKMKENSERIWKDYEVEMALYEAELSAATDKWFEARQHIERNRGNEIIFEGGFRLAWEISSE